MNIPVQPETPVLIVGAGPIGLSLAMELGWRGVACTIVDEGDGSVDLSRGGMVSARTMEYCRRWGIADRVPDTGFPQDYKLDMVYCTALTGYLLEREAYPAQGDVRPPPESPESRQWCPQLVFDPMLARAVGEFGHVAMRYHRRVTGFEDAGEQVVATIESLETGETERIAARFLVGCDGAASFVRDTAGIELDGKTLGYSINIYFRAPDLTRVTDMGEAERYLLIGPEGTWGNITVVDGSDNWRITVLGTSDKMDLDSFDAAGIVRRAMGSDDVAFEVTAVRPWRRSETLARSFRHGRVLLAGDSAHTMSPTGGFGMNTGVIDTVNLGWKLQAALDGWAGPDLLDSYRIEQAQVVDRNSRASTQNFHVWTGAMEKSAHVLEDTPEGERARREVGTILKEGLREEWECLGVMLGYRYEDSPICVADGSAPPPDPISRYHPTARPGSRAPHAWLPDGRSTLDLFGRGFVLLRLGAAPPDAAGLTEAARRQNVPFEVVDLPEPELAALYERPLVLVRPDGHVAWRDDAPPADPDALIRIVRGAGTDADRAALTPAR